MASNNDKKQVVGSRVSSRTDLHEFDARLTALFLIFMLLILVLIVKLWQLQIRDGEKNYNLAHYSIVVNSSIEPERGLIYDIQGRIIAENLPAYDVYLTELFARQDRDNENAVQERFELLSSILSLSDEEQERLSARIEYYNVHNFRVRRNITRDQLAMLETRRLELTGMYVKTSQIRHYPYDRLTSHLIGYMSQLNAEEYEELEALNYRSDDTIGRTGVERSYEALLRGAPGLDRFIQNSRHSIQDDQMARDLLGEYRHIEPIPGKNLVLTVDMELQEIVDEVASHTISGGIVVMDPRDGAVLAMYSRPGFNPNAWTGGRLSSLELRDAQTNPFHPMIDKAVNAYFPGSTYKLITAFAALEEGLITPMETINCEGSIEYGGNVFRCWNRSGHGLVNLREALAGSCDVYFYELGIQLGMQRLADYAHIFGFGERSGIGINWESPGLVPTREWHEEHSVGGFQYGFTVNTSVGQGDTRISPLQLAIAYSALANGGDLLYPRLIDHIENAEGETLFQYPRRVRSRLPFSDANTEAIEAGFVSVLNDDDGTAHESGLSYIIAAGKTGTAQVRKIETVRFENNEIYFRDRDHAWFVAYAPVDDPVIVVSVFLEHGGQGSHAAAPVAMDIMDRYFREILGWDSEIDAAIANRNTESLAELWSTHNPELELDNFGSNLAP